MSARDELYYSVYADLRENGHLVMAADVEADKMIDAFAHELAEKIRKEVEADSAWRPKWQTGMHDAADLIDPMLDNDIPDHLYNENCPGTCCGGNEDA